MNRYSALHLAVCAIALACPGAPARADYAGETGMIQVIAPPPSVKPGKLTSDDVIHTFGENRDLTLASDVHVDDTAAGVFFRDNQLVGGTIAAGTMVDSYFFHSDPVSPSVIYDATVTFTTAILGVIVLSDSLSATDDQLGRPGTKYPGGDKGRGLELSRTEDTFALSADKKTLTFHFNTHVNVDEVRVLTAATVPEPFSAALLGLGGLALAGARRLGRKSS